MSKRIAVIGGGLGGMSAAIYLAKIGFDVDIYEKNSSLGGKLNENIQRDYRFDTGPTLLTMPFVLDRLLNFAEVPETKRPDLIEIDPISRNFYSDGTILDTHKDLTEMQENIAAISPADADKFPEFMEYSKKLYDTAAEIFLFEPFHEIKQLWKEGKVPSVKTAFQIDAFKTMHERLTDYFSDEKILQLFGRFATYNGSNPYQIPATLNIIPHVEFTLGSYYPKGGMYTIVKLLKEVMQDLDVNIYCDTKVDEILHDNKEAYALRIGSDVHKYDKIIANSDVVHTFSTMIRGFPEYTLKLRNLEPSLSGMLFHWGVRQSNENLSLHNVFFSEDYKAEFNRIFSDHLHPIDPTVYVSISSKIDTDHAPQGAENWYVLVNMPFHNGQQWEIAKFEVRESVLNKLKKHGFDIENHIEEESVYTPLDFRNLYLSNRGSIYGISSNSMMSAFQRPANRSRLLRNLYFTGGSSHPGGGVPLVLLSGRHVAKIISSEEEMDFAEMEAEASYISVNK